MSFILLLTWPGYKQRDGRSKQHQVFLPTVSLLYGLQSRGLSVLRPHTQWTALPAAGFVLPPPALLSLGRTPGSVQTETQDSNGHWLLPPKQRA